jgi:hypothetical protein
MVIEPPETLSTHLPQGAPFDFILILFGEMCANIPYFVHAMATMGEMGIGKPVQGRRAGFSILGVEHKGRTIFSEGASDLDCSDLGEELRLCPGAAGEKASRLRIECQTPLRLKFESRLQADLPFHVLIRSLLRRCSSLFEAFGGGEPALDYRGMVARAVDIRCVENRLRWLDVKRYSSRQDAEMLMGGVVGHAVYEGDLGEFLPLIRLGELFHLGKQTLFGLGKIRAEAEA